VPCSARSASIFALAGVHGDVALPLLLGLGCNVPELSAIGATTRDAVLMKTIGARRAMQSDVMKPDASATKGRRKRFLSFASVLKCDARL